MVSGKIHIELRVLEGLRRKESSKALNVYLRAGLRGVDSSYYRTLVTQDEDGRVEYPPEDGVDFVFSVLPHNIPIVHIQAFDEYDGPLDEEDQLLGEGYLPFQNTIEHPGKMMHATCELTSKRGRAAGVLKCDVFFNVLQDLDKIQTEVKSQREERKKRGRDAGDAGSDDGEDEAGIAGTLEDTAEKCTIS